MRGAVPPLPHMTSWRGAKLSTGTILPFTFTIDEIQLTMF
jgi:hypothetical protein